MTHADTTGDGQILIPFFCGSGHLVGWYDPRFLDEEWLSSFLQTTRCCPRCQRWQTYAEPFNNYCDQCGTRLAQEIAR